MKNILCYIFFSVYWCQAAFGWNVESEKGIGIQKTSIDTCIIGSFKIEKSGNILRPTKTTDSLLSENDFNYQWYRNGDRIPDGARKTIQATETGYYTLQLTSKSNSECTSASANFIGLYTPATDASLVLFIDYNRNKLTVIPTIAGSSLEWYKNNQLLAGETSTAINYEADGIYKVIEHYQNINKESNELVLNTGVAIEIVKNTFLQLDDPCRPGPYLKCTFGSDIPVEYQWFLNGIPVKDSTNSHFNPVTTGDYQVSVHIPNRNRTYLSGKYRLVPADFPKSLPINRIDNACTGDALLKVDDAFMQKYQFKSIVWRLNGQDIPNETLPYYKATKNGYYTFSVKYLVGSDSYECTYNSFIDFAKKPSSDLNLGYAYAGSGCVVDSFKVFVELNKAFSYNWTKNDTLLKNEHTNELFIRDKGIYKAIINKSDGCIYETNAITLKGCTADTSNKFLMLNPPMLTTDKTTVFVNEQSFIRANGCTNVSFQWLKDTEPIAGANQAEFEIKQSGTYRLRIEKSGCMAISEPVSIVVENLLSEEPDTDIQVKVYPNPFNESVSIELPAWVNTGTEIKLTDMAGKLIKSWKIRNKYNLELKELPAGVYLLTFDIGEQRIVRRVVKRN
ncbi:T9SS type A sorting domain-containing protein [Emticicia sp. BO119]|uniref:T9SS type A sorting domain-containing protein n=1 Tax=Emticicia sp. BO119 TaxID=2757768 RepID=UPI0015F0F19E|nr:T9SS type A sorting domain-containing protein [Emticicia sp. BO119]MBA4851480.1 T9SS type A sorting domain-containing protein [Emticicia sp. BO119]